MSKPTEQDCVLAALEDPAGGVPKLVVALMAQNYRDYAGTCAALIENLQRSLADREAELAAIRWRINELFAGDYMPTQSAIELAVFYPAKSLMDRIRLDKTREEPS